MHTLSMIKGVALWGEMQNDHSASKKRKDPVAPRVWPATVRFRRHPRQRNKIYLSALCPPSQPLGPRLDSASNPLCVTATGGGSHTKVVDIISLES